MKRRTIEVHVQQAKTYRPCKLVIVGIRADGRNIRAAVEFERVFEPLEAVEAETAVIVAAFAARAGFKRHVVTSESGKRINAIVVFPGPQRQKMLAQKTSSLSGGAADLKGIARQVLR